MKDVFQGKLFVGCQADYESMEFDEKEWSLCLAAKEPWHRSAVNYTGRACDKSHPQYLMAMIDNKLILNLVDAPKAEFFDKNVINFALDFIEEQIKLGKKVFIACNEGKSRSASIALLYIVSRGLKLSNVTLEQCETEFRKTYPMYNPGAGIRGFMELNWNEYCK